MNIPSPQPPKPAIREATFKKWKKWRDRLGHEFLELWRTTATRSFHQVDGKRRVMDLIAQMVPVQTPEGERHMVYPARDERIMRIIRKVIRGLCYHHGLLSAVAERRVWADVLKYVVPQEFLVEMPPHHWEEDIFEYRYQVVNYEGIHSGWLLTFFERRTFIGIVSIAEDGLPGTKEGAEQSRKKERSSS